MREVVASIEFEFRRYKKLAESAFEQASDAELSHVPSAEGNSIAALAWHLSGNLKSRFTDFLTSDGEKPWRDRESEFEARQVARADLLARWEEGWSVLLRTLSDLNDDALGRHVRIRGEEMSVLQALHRSLAHASYHVGQVVYLAKSFRGEGWQSLSIPRSGRSRGGAMTGRAALTILVAGPYRTGTGDDPVKLAANVRAMEAYAVPLFRAGHLPIVGEWLALPLVALAGSRKVGDGPFDEIFHPIAERLVERCHGILRMGGASQGADLMVDLARKRGLRVFRRLSEVPGCEDLREPVE